MLWPHVFMKPNPIFSMSRNLGFSILDDFSTYCEN